MKLKISVLLSKILEERRKNVKVNLCSHIDL